MTSGLTNTLSILAVALLLAGCEPPSPGYYYDQALRREVFMECLQKAPAGPAATRYNDWSEVVSECNSASERIALASTSSEGIYKQPAKVEK